LRSLEKPLKTGYALISTVAHARIVTLVFRLQVAGVYITTLSQSIATRYLHALGGAPANLQRISKGHTVNHSAAT